MHTRVRRPLTVVTVIAMGLLGLVVYSPAADAAPGDPCLGCGNANIADGGLIARARTQMNELNGTNSRAQTCTDEDDTFAEDGNDTVEHTGVIQWRLTVNEQDVWDGDDTTTGYRLECWLGQAAWDAGFDGLMEVRMFDAISPRLVAQVAIDNALSLIPTQDIVTNPTTESLVAIDTWFWVTGVPEGGVSASANVPGINVVATATPGGLEFNFGDGTGLTCPDFGTPYAPGATSNCTHPFERAGVYEVSSTILWTGQYTVNGNGPFPIAAAIARTDTFSLPVSEAQALNTGG